VSERGLLALRRAELIATCESQRRELASSTEDVARSLWLVDAAVAASRRVAAHPALLASVVVVAGIVLRPGRLLRLLSWSVPLVLSARSGATAWLQRAHRTGRIS
jgi:hypothetical protein